MIRENILRQARVTGVQVFKAYLGEDYDGFGQHVLLTMSRGSTSGGFRARVASGDFNTSAHFPKGTEVVVFSNRGQLEVLTLGAPNEVRPKVIQTVIYSDADVNHLFGAPYFDPNNGPTYNGAITNVNDNDDGTNVSHLSGMGGPFTDFIDTDLGAAYAPTRFNLMGRNGIAYAGNTVEYSNSSSGGPWSSAGGSVQAYSGPYRGSLWQAWGLEWVPSGPAPSGRYWRIGYYQNSFGYYPETTLGTWEIMAPVPL